MKIKKVWSVCFSATGNTEAVVSTVSEELAFRMNVPHEKLPFTLPVDREREYFFDTGNLVVVGTPTYAGKMPNKLLPDFKSKLHGEQALAVGIVTFGNRSYDNALAELNSVLEGDGFHVIAAGAFVCQHSFAEKLAEGHPNRCDRILYKRYACDIAEKLRTSAPPFASLKVPGDPAAPYYVPKGLDGQPAKFLKAKPITNLKRCTGCGDCARLCPMGSISLENPSAVLGVCIKCHACIQGCRQHAKTFDDPAFISHKTMLERNFVTLKENEIYL